MRKLNSSPPVNLPIVKESTGKEPFEDPKPVRPPKPDPPRPKPPKPKPKRKPAKRRKKKS